MIRWSLFTGGVWWRREEFLFCFAISYFFAGLGGMLVFLLRPQRGLPLSMSTHLPIILFVPLSLTFFVMLFFLHLSFVLAISQTA